MERRKFSIDDKIEQLKLVVSKVKDWYEVELEELNQLMKSEKSCETKNCFRPSNKVTVHLRKS